MEYAEYHANVLLAEGGSYHEPELFDHGWTKVSLSAARNRFSVIGWQDRYRGWHYPKWQFDDRWAVRPQIVQLLKLFRSRDSLYVIGNCIFPIGEKKSLLQLIRQGQGEKAVAKLRAKLEEEKSFDNMSPQLIERLNKQVRELRDPTRHVIVSSLSRRMIGVYDVAQNVYCHQHISDGCLVKDRKMADAIVKHLHERKTPHLHVIRVRPTEGGYKALDNIPGEKGRAPWRPKFKTVDDTPVFVPIAPSASRRGFADAMLFASRHKKYFIKELAECKDRRSALQLLVDKCKLTERQADAVLEMRLWSLTREFLQGLEKELLAGEKPTKKQRIS